MAYNLGNDQSDTNTFPGQGDRGLITRFTSSGAGTLSGGYAYWPTGHAGGENFKLVIYNDNSGAVGTVLEASAGTSIPSGGGWISVGSMSASISASTDYHIGIIKQSGYESFAEDYLYGGGYDTVRIEDSYTSPTDNPTEVSSYSDWQVCAYVIVEEGGGGGHTFNGLTLLGVGS